ncbi:MAG: hypothetical protein KJ880_06425 [Candidatus Omnitrophica bacterium]|nr:hypothetical protein [Candidatus Omnitrophota bacterium]MBU1869654.1 hypothetical protein [Candidatus Omnitrophota bacterium]
MKKLLVIMAALMIAMPAMLRAADKPKEFVVYSDKGARDNHYIPSGWMGDTGDIKLNDQSANNPHSGTTCMEFVFSGKRSQNNGWAGVYWQNPPNNWGSKKGGFDLTGMTKLSFWARGAKGGEVIQKFMVGGIKGTYPDTTSVEIGPIELTDTWKQYTINLAGKDLSYINGGFNWVTTADLNPDGATFYLDDIKFEADTSMKPEGKKQEAMPFYVYADSSSPKNHFIASGWMGDYGDLKYDGKSKDDPYLGDTCIKILYNGKASQGARWAGIFWQNPPNNWGSIDGGFDLANATKLTFWAKGAQGGERIEEFKVGGIMGEFSDSDSASIGPVILNKEWTQYTIDLKGKDMSYIIGGFCWSASLDNNPEGATFYLDEIKYE